MSTKPQPLWFLKPKWKIPENQVGFVVGTFETTDPDANDTFTCSLISSTGSDDNAKFTIDGNGNLALDFEQKQQYIIKVRTTDAGVCFTKKLHHCYKKC